MDIVVQYLPLASGRKETKLTEQLPFLQRMQMWYGFVAVLAMAGMYLFVERAEPIVDATVGVEKKIEADFCAGLCDARSNQHLRRRGGDPLDPHFLLKAVEKEREKLHNMLRDDYGEEAFKLMWLKKENDQVIGEKVCVSPDPPLNVSYIKLRRKLQMKVLQVQIRILDEGKNLEGCDCTISEPAMHRRLQQRVVLPTIPPFYERFVWVTGGHSSAAGHGNLFNESYTAFMERGVKDVFRSVGIDFVGRNHAMGGMNSAPQLALCNEAVYGNDADVITWDFGMTDGKAHWKTNFFASRTGLHSNRPIHFSIGNRGRNYKNRMGMLKLAEEAGVPTLQLLPNVEADVAVAVPDSFGLSDEELAKLGPYARYFKCKGALEKEDKCGDLKYNVNVCPNRRFKASWHPGWRQHATTGNILALFLTETMIDALKVLIESPEDPRQLYDRLLKEEDVEYAKFFTSTVPDVTEGLISQELVAAGLKSQYFFRNKAICKTALLPAQTRFLGIMTDSKENVEAHGFVQGIEVEQASKNPPREGNRSDMTLVLDTEDRQECPVELNIDHKDYFYCTQDWGWASLFFPGDAEKAAYAPAGFNPVGVVVVCFSRCNWGRCPPGEVSVQTFNVDWKMDLNREPVSELSPIDECFAVKTENGFYHKPNADGQYELRLWIDKSDSVPNRFARIASIVVI